MSLGIPKASLQSGPRLRRLWKPDVPRQRVQGSAAARRTSFNGEKIPFINVHSTSRGGSDPLFGSNQPPADAGDSARTNQATAVRTYINNALAIDPDLHFGVLGDFNGFTWENAIAALEAGAVLTDLNRTLPVEERYSYLFEGNLQALTYLGDRGLFAARNMTRAINADHCRNAAHDHERSSLWLFTQPHARLTTCDRVLRSRERAGRHPFRRSRQRLDGAL